MADYLPNVNFDRPPPRIGFRYDIRRSLSGRKPSSWYNWEDSLESMRGSRLLKNSDMNPVNILRVAFQKYFIRQRLQNNTIGLEILYTDRPGQLIPKKILLAKRVRPNQRDKQFRLNSTREDTRTRVKGEKQFEESGRIFRNDQINTVSQYLAPKTILQITLCEVYNDGDLKLDPPRPNSPSLYYTPYSMEVALLYRNIPVTLRESTLEDRRRELEEQRRLRNARREARDRSMTDEQRQERDERRNARTIPMTAEMRVFIDRIRRLSTDISYGLQEGADPAEMRRIRQEMYNSFISMRAILDPRDSANRRLIDQRIRELTQTLEENPRQLIVVPAPDTDPVIDSASYDSEEGCRICYEPVVGEGCRVNCPAGHIYHCGCINKWRNTRAPNGSWHNTCPYCRAQITQMYHVNIPEGFTTGFGKRRRATKGTKATKGSKKSLALIKKYIKYLQKL